MNRRHQRFYYLIQCLAVEFDSRRVSITALEGQAVEGPVTAALPVTADGLEGEPIGVRAAASFVGRSTAVLLGGADSGLIKAVSVLLRLVDTVARDESVQQVSDESTLDGAGPGSTVAVGVVLGALAGDADVGAADGGDVLDLPRDTGGALVFGVPHGALVAVSEDLAHLVDGVLGLALASAVVVIKVAPAAVLVDGPDGLTDGSGESPVGLAFILQIFPFLELEIRVGGFDRLHGALVLGVGIFSH